MARRGRRAIRKSFDLQLTSMMDILVIIVVFLLKSYQTSNAMFDVSGNIAMPSSVAQDVPELALSVIISKDAITYEGQRILEVQKTLTNSGKESYAIAQTNLDSKEHDGLLILPLFDQLKKSRDHLESILMRRKNEEERKFHGTLAISADKTIPYAIIKKVMYTAGYAGYKTFKFAAIKKNM